MFEAVSPEDCAFAALAARGRRAQWSADRDVDWQLPVRPPRWLSRRAYVSAISQLYHGEVATVRACRRLADEIADPAARDCLEVQIADEMRHANAYAGYLDRLGGVAPVDPAVAEAHDEGMAWQGAPAGLVVLYHVVLEGEALMLHGDFRRWFRCPLFGAINRRIEVDEARHVAFGRLFLRSSLAEMPADQRMDIYRWVCRLWRSGAESAAERYWGWMPAPHRLKQNNLRRRWNEHVETLISVGLVSAEEARMADDPVGVVR